MMEAYADRFEGHGAVGQVSVFTIPLRFGDTILGHIHKGIAKWFESLVGQGFWKWNPKLEFPRLRINMKRTDQWICPKWMLK